MILKNPELDLNIQVQFAENGVILISPVFSTDPNNEFGFNLPDVVRIQTNVLTTKKEILDAISVTLDTFYD